MKSILCSIKIITGVFMITHLMSSCVLLIPAWIVQGKAKKTITVENGIIPPDFGKEKSTLILITIGKNSYDKPLKRIFEKRYNGPLKLVNEKKLSDPEYSDVTKYRFVFDFKFESHEYSSPSGAEHVPVRRFVIIDRKENKKYYCTMTSGFFGRMMKAYAANLNARFPG